MQEQSIAARNQYESRYAGDLLRATGVQKTAPLPPHPTGQCQSEQESARPHHALDPHLIA